MLLGMPLYSVYGWGGACVYSSLQFLRVQWEFAGFLVLSIGSTPILKQRSMCKGSNNGYFGEH